MQRLKMLADDPIYGAVRVLSFFYRIALSLRRDVVLDGKVVLKGWPMIETNDGGRVHIGANVTLYSTRRRYFAHLSGPTRLYADGGRIRIGENTRINGATIHARESIEIGANCLIAANTSILDANGHRVGLENPSDRLSTSDAPKKNVWIGLNCIVLKGVKIGEGAVVGAGSVVIYDVPARSLVRGNPADVVSPG